MHEKCTGALMQKAHFAETKAKCKCKLWLAWKLKISKKQFVLLAIYKLNVKFNVVLTLIPLWEKVEGNRMQGR